MCVFSRVQQGMLANFKKQIPDVESVGASKEHDTEASQRMIVYIRLR